MSAKRRITIFIVSAFVPTLVSAAQPVVNKMRALDNNIYVPIELTCPSVIGGQLVLVTSNVSGRKIRYNVLYNSKDMISFSAEIAEDGNNFSRQLAKDVAVSGQHNFEQQAYIKSLIVRLAPIFSNICHGTESSRGAYKDFIARMRAALISGFVDDSVIDPSTNTYLYQNLPSK